MNDTEKASTQEHGASVSLRDYFAGKVLPAVVELLERDSETDDFPARVALIAYEIADAMLKEREEAP